MQVSFAKDVLENSPSKGQFDEEMQEDNRPLTAKADIGNAQLNWADEQEHMPHTEVATRTPDTYETEEEAGGATRHNVEGKEEIERCDTLIQQDPTQPDTDMSQSMMKTSPKRTKELKTDRETPYQHGRTRRKTRVTQSPATIMKR
jgi:hypothetical protein